MPPRPMTSVTSYFPILLGCTPIKSNHLGGRSEIRSPAETGAFRATERPKGYHETRRQQTTLQRILVGPEGSCLVYSNYAALLRPLYSIMGVHRPFQSSVSTGCQKNAVLNCSCRRRAWFIRVLNSGSSRRLCSRGSRAK